MTRIYKIEGMSCGGCAKNIEKAMNQAFPDLKVAVDHVKKEMRVEGIADTEAVKQVVEDAGFDFKGE